MTTDTDDAVILPPPHLAPVDDEAAILGACLRSEAAVDALVGAGLTPGIFWLPAHAAVWGAVYALWERGETVEPRNVNAEVGVRGDHRTVGPTLVADLYGDVPTSAIVTPLHYAGRVLDAHEKRAGDAALHHGRVLIGTPDGGTAEEILDAVTAQIQAARDLRTRGSVWWRVGELVDDVIDATVAPVFEEDAVGVPWPYRDLGGDHGPLNPMMPGQVWVIGGRPGDGKSTVLRNVCEHASFGLGWPSLLASFEVKARDVTAAVISHQARVLLDHLTKPGRFNPSDAARVGEYRAALAAAPLTVIDDADTTIGGLDRAIREHKPRVVALDYLQIAVPDSNRPEHRRVEVERYMRAVKRLADRREVPIVVGSQLNRDVAGRRDKRPHLTDLRETGGIEQDAHGVVLLHRPEVYEPNGDRQGEADFIVAKQRNGPTDTVTLASRLHFASFADMA